MVLVDTTPPLLAEVEAEAENEKVLPVAAGAAALVIEPVEEPAYTAAERDPGAPVLVAIDVDPLGAELAADTEIETEPLVLGDSVAESVVVVEKKDEVPPEVGTDDDSAIVLEEVVVDTDPIGVELDAETETETESLVLGVPETEKEPVVLEESEVGRETEAETDPVVTVDAVEILDDELPGTDDEAETETDTEPVVDVGTTLEGKVELKIVLDVVASVIEKLLVVVLVGSNAEDEKVLVNGNAEEEVVVVAEVNVVDDSRMGVLEKEPVGAAELLMEVTEAVTEVPMEVAEAVAEVPMEVAEPVIVLE